MIINPVDINDVGKLIEKDREKLRFTARVFLTNNIHVYFSLLDLLENKAERLIHLSDPDVCTGNDTIPNMRNVVEALEVAKDKDILITSVAEYLRMAQNVEKNAASIPSILRREGHSTKRVWIPLFGAKALFEEAAGVLEEERFRDCVYEVVGEPSGFEVTVLPPSFKSVTRESAYSGMRAWLTAWDTKTVKSKAVLFTRHAKNIAMTDGIYTIQVVLDPFGYVLQQFPNEGQHLSKGLGSDDQWLSLLKDGISPGQKIGDVLCRRLNIMKFDIIQLLTRWRNSDEIEKWMVWLWYKLGLNTSSDYCSMAISSANSYSQLSSLIINKIFDYVENPNFELFAKQRNEAVQAMGIRELGNSFWEKFDELNDDRKRLKILSGNTDEQKVRIIEMLGRLLKDGKRIQDYKMVLQEKYPDLVTYLFENDILPEELSAYFIQYKNTKIRDEFSLEASEKAESVNIYEYDTRSQILNKIYLDNQNAYFLWIDGMGVEWIDLLLKKIKSRMNIQCQYDVKVGTAVIPTVTSVNMSFADPKTVTQKIDDLDHIGHRKDKAEINYFSVVVKQINKINEIATEIVSLLEGHECVVITADHGMSRLAAKGFHEVNGTNPPRNAEVCNLGRYCICAEKPQMSYSHTVCTDNVIAYKSYNHFTSSGYAPGEIHGGASPEEVLVPIITIFNKYAGKRATKSTYKLTNEVLVNGNGEGTVFIATTGPVDNLQLELGGDILTAVRKNEGKWEVYLRELRPNKEYSVKVYLNKKYTAQEEIIKTKSAGIAVNDDF